ncbi:Hypothetical protein SCLAV_0446, partial [Streptomyces clavuligerus]
MRAPPWASGPVPWTGCAPSIAKDASSRPTPRCPACWPSWRRRATPPGRPRPIWCGRVSCSPGSTPPRCARPTPP